MQQGSISNNHRLVYKCSSVRSFGRIEGEGVHDEGVDVADGHGSYCRCRLVVRGRDRRKNTGHDVLHGVVLAGIDLEQGHGLAFRQDSEKVGQQHVEADIVTNRDVGGIDGRFFINHKEIRCNTTFASDPTGIKSNFSYFRTRRMEFTYKAGEVLLAIVSEVLKHRFRLE